MVVEVPGSVVVVVVVVVELELVLVEVVVGSHGSVGLVVDDAIVVLEKSAIEDRAVGKSGMPEDLVKKMKTRQEELGSSASPRLG